MSKLAPGSEDKMADIVKAAVPLGRMGERGDIGLACVYLASSAANYVSGTAGRSLAHAHACAPPCKHASCPGGVLPCVHAYCPLAGSMWHASMQVQRMVCSMHAAWCSRLGFHWTRR